MTEANTILYFWNASCSVCGPLYKKLKHLVEDEFPNLTIQKIDIANHPDLRAKYQVFSSPLVLLLLDGKEYLRSSGNVSLHELRQKIQRIYQLKFNK
jgi:thioredoxin-like negative regulator of GroEL